MNDLQQRLVRFIQHIILKAIQINLCGMLVIVPMASLMTDVAPLAFFKIVANE